MMARVELITERDRGLTPQQQEVFDWVVQSRGSMIRPFQVLLHSPDIAREVAGLGARIRFESSMSDHDRELVILAAAAALDCAFEWDSHLPLARSAGVGEEAIRHLAGEGGELDREESVLVDFVHELHARGRVSDEVFAACRERLGEAGVVELAVTVGYYTMLGFVMGACAAC